MRVVADTNVVVSGLLWSGPPHQILNHAIAGRIGLETSVPLLAELGGVLERKKFADRIELLATTPAQLVAMYAALAMVVKPASIARTIHHDPEDDAVLACAVGAQADAIVSGDHHLLALKTFRHVPILSAARLVERIAGEQ